VHIGHLSRGDEESLRKSQVLSVQLVEEVVSEAIFLMCGDHDELDLLEQPEALLLNHDFCLKLAKELVGRIVLHSYEGMRDVDEENGLEAFDDIVEEQVELLACEEGEGEEGALLVREDAEGELGLDGKVLKHLAHLMRIFIYILFVIEDQGTQPLEHEHLRHTASLQVPL
jgi:hypothetical protein